MSPTFIKSDLVKIIGKKHKLPAILAQKFVDAIFDSITDALKRGETVSFGDIGILKPRGKGKIALKILGEMAQNLDATRKKPRWFTVAHFVKGGLLHPGFSSDFRPVLMELEALLSMLAKDNMRRVSRVDRIFVWEGQIERARALSKVPDYIIDEKGNSQKVKIQAPGQKPTFGRKHDQPGN